MAVDDLTTFAHMQDYFGSSVDDEDFINFLITAASKWANEYTSRKLASRIYASETIDTMYDGNDFTGTNYILLRQYPITAIASVYEDTERDFAVASLVAATEYIYYAERGKLLFPDDIISSGFQNYRVYYTAGYALASVPEDLEMTICRLVDFWEKSRSGHRFGVASTGVADKRIVYEKGIPIQIQNAMASYHKIVVE